LPQAFSLFNAVVSHLFLRRKGRAFALYATKNWINKPFFKMNEANTMTFFGTLPRFWLVDLSPLFLQAFFHVFVL
jgi:hypothetical protein